MKMAQSSLEIGSFWKIPSLIHTDKGGGPPTTPYQQLRPFCDSRDSDDSRDTMTLDSHRLFDSVTLH